MFQVSKKNKTKTFFIITIFIALLSYLVYVFLSLNDFGPMAVPIAIISSIIASWGAYYHSDKIVLSLNGARPATKEENQRMYENLEGLCIAANLPMPKLYIMDDLSPNAFATGRNPEHAVICVTTGLMEKLDSYELEGVLAHELSHIKNYDILLQTIASVFVGFVTILSDLFFRISVRSNRKREDDNNSSSALFAIIGVIFLLFSPIVATLLQLALSRNREFLADSSAIELTRNPQGLISALKKISSDPDPLEQANKSTECLYISNPLKKEGISQKLFSTHPPIEDRIKALENWH